MIKRSLYVVLALLGVLASALARGEQAAYMLVQIDPVKATPTEKIVNVIRTGSLALADYEFQEEYTRSLAAAASVIGGRRKILPFFIEYPNDKEIKISQLAGDAVKPEGGMAAKHVCYGAFICAFKLEPEDIERIQGGANIGIAYTDDGSVPESWGKLLFVKHYIATNCEFGYKCAVASKVRRKYVGEISLFKGDDRACIPSNSAYYANLSTMYAYISDNSWRTGEIEQFGSENIPSISYALPPLRKVQANQCVPFKYLGYYLNVLRLESKFEEIKAVSAVAFRIIDDHAFDTIPLPPLVRRNGASNANDKLNGIDLKKKSDPVGTTKSKSNELIINYSTDEAKAIFDQAAQALVKINAQNGAIYADIESRLALSTPDKQTLILPGNRYICEKLYKHVARLPHNQGSTIVCDSKP